MALARLTPAPQGKPSRLSPWPLGAWREHARYGGFGLLAASGKTPSRQTTTGLATRRWQTVMNLRRHMSPGHALIAADPPVREAACNVASLRPKLPRQPRDLRRGHGVTGRLPDGSRIVATRKVSPRWQPFPPTCWKHRFRCPPSGSMQAYRRRAPHPSSSCFVDEKRKEKKEW